MFCTVIGAAKSTLCGLTTGIGAVAALPKKAESGGVFVHATLPPVTGSLSNQFALVRSQLPDPSRLAGSSTPLASQVRSRAWALPLTPHMNAATAAEMHAKRDRTFIGSPSIDLIAHSLD